MAGWAKLFIGAAAGAAATYLFDPNSGRGRRAQMTDQAKARMRDARREAERRAGYQSGRMQGAVHEVAGGSDMPADDMELMQKVRSEAMGPAGFNSDHIELVVNAGTVTLRGTSHDPPAEDGLIERIREVAGVREVRNELTPA